MDGYMDIDGVNLQKRRAVSSGNRIGSPLIVHAILHRPHLAPGPYPDN